MTSMIGPWATPGGSPFEAGAKDFGNRRTLPVPPRFLWLPERSGEASCFGGSFALHGSNAAKVKARRFPIRSWRPVCSCG